MPLSTRPADSSNRLLRDDVFNQLFEAIIDGSLPPGENLRDDELVDVLKVSRAPIREALQQLREMGLVEMAPNRYTRVAPIDLDMINQTINTMLVLYEIAVTHAVPVLSDEDQQDLVSLFDDLRASVADDDLSAFSVLHYEYFLRYAAAIDNRPMLAAMERLVPHLRRALTPRPGLLSPTEILMSTVPVHEAALAGDGPAAAAAVHKMAEPSRLYYLERIRKVTD